MAGLNQNYMAKSKVMKKSDYIDELIQLTHSYAKKLTVKQLKQLIAKYA